MPHTRHLNTIGSQLRLTQGCTVLAALMVATLTSLISSRDTVIDGRETRLRQAVDAIQRAYDSSRRLPEPQRTEQLRTSLHDHSHHSYTFWITMADGTLIQPREDHELIPRSTLKTLIQTTQANATQANTAQANNNWAIDTNTLRDSFAQSITVSGRNYVTTGQKTLSYFTTLWVAQDVTDYANFQKSLIRSSALIYVGCLSLSLLISSVLTRRIIQPIQQLSAAAATITPNSLASQRLATGTSSKEVEELTATFNALLARLESTLSQQRTFSQSLSHELRGPLMILNLCHRRMLRESTTLDSNQHDILRIQQRELKRMEHLLNDLLALFKAGEAINQAAPEPINVAALLESSMESSRLANPHPIELNRDIKATHNHQTWWAMGHHNQLEQVVINLIGNAQKYSTMQQPIRIHLRASGDQLLISIEDEGIGIPAQDQEHIFKPFFRGSNTSEIEGTGLGLPVVKALVEAMGGSLHVWSEPHRGTRFTIALQRYWPSRSGQLQRLA